MLFRMILRELVDDYTLWRSVTPTHLNAQYVLNETKRTFRRQLDMNEMNDAEDSRRKRSSGRARIFLTADGCVGLASHKIEIGDKLYPIKGVDDLYLVVRFGRDGAKFLLIGRAVVLLPGLEERFLSSFDLRHHLEQARSKLLLETYQNRY